MQSIIQYYRLRRKTEAIYNKQSSLFDKEKGLSSPSGILDYSKSKKYYDRTGVDGSSGQILKRDFASQPAVDNHSHVTQSDLERQTSDHRNRLASESTVASQSQAGSTNEYDYDEHHEDSKTLTVEFDDEHDPENPRNWPKSTKWLVSAILGCTWALVGWNSAVSSAVAKQIQKEFGVSAVTESLSTGLYLIALGLGSWIVSDPP